MRFSGKMAKKAQKTAKQPARRRTEAGGRTAPKRRNMRAVDRERAIVDEAIRFFAERGFEGQTRELAKRMGITHSGIYRHFPSKEALIERVYQEVYLSRWSPDWGALIRDRALPLEARLTRFLSRLCRACVRVQLGTDLRVLRHEVVRHHRSLSRSSPP